MTFDPARELPDHKVVGAIVACRVSENEFLVSVRLSAPVAASEIGRETWIGGFHYGTPIGCDIQPRFEGTHADGLVEISVFDREVPWTPGTLERQTAQFIGLALAVPK